MNNLRGSIAIEINGVMRYAKFGTYQTAVFCETRGIAVEDFSSIISEEKIKNKQVPFLVWIDFYYSAFVAGAVAARAPQDFDAFDVSCWIDEDPELLEKLNKATEGANGPNGQNRQQRRATEKAPKK